MEDAKPVSAAVFAPDGRSIITASHDGTIRIWESASAEQVSAWEKEDQLAKK